MDHRAFISDLISDGRVITKQSPCDQVEACVKLELLLPVGAQNLPFKKKKNKTEKQEDQGQQNGLLDLSSS